MWWVVLGVHVDVHGEWVMLWVAAMNNVLAILSMALCQLSLHQLHPPSPLTVAHEAIFPVR